MIRTMRGTRALIATFATIVAGCSGGGSSLAPTTTPSNAPSKSASISFTMHWTSASTSAPASRHRNYVPSTAQSVTVSVDGGQAQYLNNPATTLVIAAPPGVDNFTFATFDEPNGEGSMLSAATVTQTVVAGTGNFVSATLNGVIASIGIALANPTLPAGTAATTAVSVTALDADGNVIVGPGGYNTAIHLSVNDPTNSGTLSLSGHLVQTPSATANIMLNYTGGTLASGLPGAPLATVVASASGITSASAAFTPTPTSYVVGRLVDSVTTLQGAVGGITAGPDGNMWVTDSMNDSIGKVTPAGVVTTYPLGNAKSEPAGIISASDGNLWFTEVNNAGASGHIGFITTAGAITEFNSVGSTPNALVDGGNGSIYYVDATKGIGEQLIAPNSSTLQEVADPGAGTSSNSEICLGPDHALYYTSLADSVKRISLANFPSDTPTGLQLPNQTGAEAGGVARGPDGNIWVTDSALSDIYVVSTAAFAITSTFPTLTQNMPEQIVAGKDGALWFTNGAYDGAYISRVTTSGAMSDFAELTSTATSIAVAQDGSIWYGNSSTDTLAKLVY